MYQGNWTCSTCGGTITELPFEPRSNSGLTCRTCYAKSKGDQGNQPAPTTHTATAPADPADIPEDAGVAGEPAPPPPDELDGATPITPGGEKPKFSGDWKCSQCDGSITSLPFEPRSTENLKCLDCFKQSKG